MTMTSSYKYAEHAQDDLQVPTGDDGTTSDSSHRRKISKKVDESLQNAFMIPKRTYERQYAGLYFCRLASLRQRATASAKRKWGEHRYPFVERLLATEPGKTCVVVGTVYANVKLKPNVLDDICLEVAFSFTRLDAWDQVRSDSTMSPLSRRRQNTTVPTIRSRWKMNRDGWR